MEVLVRFARPLLLSAAFVGLGTSCTADEEALADASCVGEPCITDEECACSDTCIVGECAPAIRCNQAHLSWTSPVENTDGTCLRDLGGYILHFGRESRNYTEVIDVGVPCVAMEEVPCGSEGETAMQYTCDFVFDRPIDDDGTWFFAMTAYNLAEIQSDYSGEASKEIVCDDSSDSLTELPESTQSPLETPSSTTEATPEAPVVHAAF